MMKSIGQAMSTYNDEDSLGRDEGRGEALIASTRKRHEKRELSVHLSRDATDYKRIYGTGLSSG